MTNDLTKGSPLKQILFFSIPFLIGNLFQQFYNIADMVIVGRTLGSLAYAAVGSTGSIVWFASGAIQSLTVGFSVIIAQNFGACDFERVKKSFASSIKLCAIITVPFSVICMLLAKPMLLLMRTPEELLERSYSYIIWIFAGLIATALFNLLSNSIRALGDSRTPLYFLIIACVINIALDIVFIAIFKMDTNGAGLATVIAQLISGLLCILYITKKHPSLHISARHFLHDKPLNMSLLRVGIPMAFLNMVLSIGSVITQFVTNGLGTVYISSQTTGAKLETFVTQPLLSIGSAVSVFTAQNYGARQYKRVLNGASKAHLIGLIWWIIASFIMLPFGKTFITLLAGDVTQEVINNSYSYILINTMLVFVVSPLIICKPILQAVGRTFWTMISGFTEIIGRAGVSMLVMALISSAILSDATGFTLICFSNPCAWLLGLLTVLPDYISMRKALKKLIKQTSEN